MIRINGTYPSDSITGAGLSATDDSLFIVSLVLPPSVLSQSISKLFRQGNVPAFSQRQKLLRTKKRTSLGMNFSAYSYSKPIQSSSTTEEENQCKKPGQPFCDFGELCDAPRCKSSPEQDCNFLLGTFRPSQLEQKTQQTQLRFLPVWRAPAEPQLWQTSNSKVRKCSSCLMTGTYTTGTSRLQHLGAYSNSWPEGKLHKPPQRLKNAS